VSAKNATLKDSADHQIGVGTTVYLALSLRSERWRNARDALELFGLKWSKVFSESFLYLSQRMENGCDPRSQFRIFVRKGCIIALAVQHCRDPSVASKIEHQPYPVRITERLNVEMATL
jgi:hypothetical protein